MKSYFRTGILAIVVLLLSGCAHHHFSGTGHHVGSVYTDCSAPHIGTCVSTCNSHPCASKTVTVLPPVYQAAPVNPCQSPCGSTLPPVYQPVAQNPCVQPCGYPQPARVSPCSPHCSFPQPQMSPCAQPCGYPQSYSYPQQPHMPPAQVNPTSMVYPIDMSGAKKPGATGVQTYLYQPAGGVVYQY